MSIEDIAIKLADQSFAIAFCLLIYFDMRKKLDTLILKLEQIILKS